MFLSTLPLSMFVSSLKGKKCCSLTNSKDLNENSKCLLVIFNKSCNWFASCKKCGSKMTFIGLMTWKKRWCNNKNLYKQKQQQTLEATKFCENFENFEKWTWQVKSGEIGVTHRDNTNEDGVVASIIMNANDLESFVVSAN